ncbi:lytic transglycosylase domain-containing protein [Anaerosporobacter faecicola]|uniref:lytic transglycosylase domain-containing protein n=1 Tax=Anaerosporobacter faecicola TaxID=2718714 RepID=UPI0014397244|nr:lytic transglycosylase domain-containing protein [Anaerosporobacter faecicola]
MQVNNVTTTNQVVNQSSKVKATSKATKTSFDSYLNSEKEVTLEDIFQKAADKYNVSIDLLKAIAKQESNFNPNAVSKSGAQGVMQLMPATAKELGVTDSFDAEQNIMGGAKYISKLLDQYDGNTKLALAAYNAGSGNVRKYGGIPPFKETQNYVVKVMQYYKQNLDASDVTVTTSDTTSKSTNGTQPQTAINSTTVPVNTTKPVEIQESITTLAQLEEKLDELFSMDDYLKMIEIMFGDENDGTEQEDASQKAYSQLSMSTPVMNMLKSI